MSQPTVTPIPTSTIYPTQPSATSAPTSQTDPTSAAQKSPLLFFVALGFAIVFTNLWIIIGVKYYFRYRAARGRGVPMSGVALGALTGGGGERRRRRREKKLMTSEEVEEKFPLQTYKTWRAAREAAGLSTAGGVEAIDGVEAQQAREALASAPAPSLKGVNSRPTSVAPAAHDTDEVYEVGVRPTEDIAVEGRRSMEHTSRPGTKGAQTQQVERTATDTSVVRLPTEHAAPKAAPVAELATTGQPRQSTSSRHEATARRSTNVRPAAAALEEDDDEEDDEAEAAAAAHLPEDLGSGDTCAICIDTLEDEDLVRGLTCGHAFHNTCVDVWLTTRRAICPLCKRDYHVRRPTADGAGGLGNDDGDYNGDAPVETREERRERRRRRREAREAERRAVEQMQAQGHVNAVPQHDEDFDRAHGHVNSSGSGGAGGLQGRGRRLLANISSGLGLGLGRGRNAAAAARGRQPDLEQELDNPAAAASGAAEMQMQQMQQVQTQQRARGNDLRPTRHGQTPIMTGITSG